MKQDSLVHLGQVAAVNIGAFGLTLSDVNEVLKTLSLAVAISYTLWKFYKEFKGRNENKEAKN